MTLRGTGPVRARPRLFHFPTLNDCYHGFQTWCGITDVYLIDGISIAVVLYGLWVWQNILQDYKTFFKNLKNPGIQMGGLLINMDTKLIELTHTIRT